MNRTEARDQMNAHIAEAAALQPGTVIVWPLISNEMPTAEHWIRPTIKHGPASQASLSGAEGEKRWKKMGVVIIQCFALVGDGEKEIDDLAQNFIGYYERLRNSPIWYRNIRGIEVGKDGAYVQVNVMADFEYDDFN